MISVSVGEELRSGLVRRFWFRVSREVAVERSAVAAVRGRLDWIWVGETVSLPWLLAGRVTGFWKVDRHTQNSGCPVKLEFQKTMNDFVVCHTQYFQSHLHWTYALCSNLTGILGFVFFFKLLCCCSIIVVSIFSPPLPTTPAKPTSLPCFHPPPWFCPCVLYSSSWKPFSLLSPPPSPLTTVTMFLTSMSLIVFCLLFSFVDYVPVKSEIIWYLSLTTWLISLSIMLSRSIHAVAKGRSSFFLSAA